MATEPPKSPAQEQPAYAMPYPSPYAPTFVSPAAAYPPSFYTAPGAEGGAIAIDANGMPTALPPGTQIMMLPPLPPGMVYAFPPPPPGQGAFVPSALPSPPTGGSSPSAAQMRMKRKQVKNACTNCATACKRCDEARPCERCVKYGLIESCVDGQRKERKKGIKRGPYKRRNKDQEQQQFTEYTPEAGDWQTQPPPANAQAPPPGSGPPPGQEGYYPMCYPVPGLLPAPPPMPADTQPGGGDQQGAPQVMPPYYYPPPFPYAAHMYGMVPPPPQMMHQPPPEGMVPSAGNDGMGTNAEHDGMGPNGEHDSMGPNSENDGTSPLVESDSSASTSPMTPRKRASEGGEDVPPEKRPRTEK